MNSELKKEAKDSPTQSVTILYPEKVQLYKDQGFYSYTERDIDELIADYLPESMDLFFNKCDALIHLNGSLLNDIPSYVFLSEKRNNAIKCLKKGD